MIQTIDKTGHMRPYRNGNYSFLITKNDGTKVYREFKKKKPFLNSLNKNDVKQVIIDLV